VVEDLTMARRSLETAESTGQDELRPPTDATLGARLVLTERS
jgi:hypothetical protein